MSDALTISPAMGLTLLIVMVVSGYGFRRNWKAQGPHWRLKAWFYGVPALISFTVLAFVPLQT